MDAGTRREGIAASGKGARRIFGGRHPAGGVGLVLQQSALVPRHAGTHTRLFSRGMLGVKQGAGGICTMTCSKLGDEMWGREGPFCDLTMKMVHRVI